MPSFPKPVVRCDKRKIVIDTPAASESEHFDILTPPGGVQVPFLFNSPHSGAHYPEAFVASSRLPIHDLRKSEDCFVDELFGGAVDMGAPVMRARFPRAFIDLNREPYELDQKMFAEALPDFVNTRSVRVAGGLGTIARIVAEGQNIYFGKLSVTEALERIDTYYKPYHRALVGQLRTIREEFGLAVLVDCHSMPSARMAGENRPRPDFVIGDRFGTSCDGEITEIIHEQLTALGYRVSRNKPYAGGFITERYGNPGGRVHAVQIEVNRALYMDEKNYSRSSGYSWLVADLASMTRRLISLYPRRTGTQSIAAE